MSRAAPTYFRVLYATRSALNDPSHNSLPTGIAVAVPVNAGVAGPRAISVTAIVFGSIASAMSAASLLSLQSAGSALSHQSNGSVLSSQADHALRGRRTHGRVPAGLVAAGVLSALAATAVHRGRR